MNSAPKRKTKSYIVRIWAEYLDEHPPRWCGVIQAVESGEKFHFTELAQVVEIIRQKTQSPYPNAIERIKRGKE